MTRDDIGARVRTILADHQAKFRREALSLGDDRRLAELGFDSLDRIEVTMAVELELDIELSDDEVERIDTVGGFIDHLAGALGLAEAV
jgi:acyl carrier protein